MSALEKPLTVDLHCHLERDEDIPLLAELTAPDLDVLAITNHTNKRAIILEQSRRIEQLASLRPDLLLLYGLEWNVLGNHVNVIFPARTVEESYISGFLDGFEPCDEFEQLSAALEYLADFPAGKPMLILNHPAHYDPVKFPLLADALAKPGIPLSIGVDGFHGHQNWVQKYEDPFDYPGSAPNGLCDLFYQRGIMVPLLAGSDFHPNKQDEKPDYAPGTYQRILLSGAAKDPVQILAALRQGRTAVDQNLTIDRIAVECERQFDDYVNININYTGFRMVQKLELIVGTGTAVEVKGLKEDLQPGSQTVEFSLDIPGITYVRVRGKSSGPCCVEGDKNRIAAFISSAVFCSDK